jgi:ssDNA-binding Zn-finger/Zn-ribbon topoisomerase 1
MTLEELLESIRTRKAVSPYGIAMASAYVRGMEPCLTGDGLCPTKLFKLASAELWQKELEESFSRLTYCDELMAEQQDFMEKSIREGTDITKGAVIEYDCVLSSRRKDRDGDIVEQKGGLDVDPRMPALWQHIQVQPIGKHVAVLLQDETVTKSRFALADTELGRDAATLLKFGALRKSIGFKPYDFIPAAMTKGSDGRDQVSGWHIRKAGCFEGSLVSIPANADAVPYAFREKAFDGVVTAYSRDLLKHAMVKSWAKGLYQSRPVQVPGADLSTKNADCAGKDCSKCGKGKMDSTGSCPGCGNVGKSMGAQAQGGDEGKACPKCEKGKLDSTGTCPNCGHMPTPKSVTELTEKSFGGFSPYPVGSWEEKQHALRITAADHLKANGVMVEKDTFVDLSATFADAAVVNVWPLPGSTAKSACYLVPWSEKAGKPEWHGIPKAVEIRQIVIDKMLAAGVRGEVAKIHAKQDNLSVLSRRVAAKMLEADGTGGEVESAFQTVAKAHATLKQLREGADLASLFSN